MSQSSVSVRCDDCGASHALSDGHDGTVLLAELHIFLQQHATCSYSVSVNLTSAEEPVGERNVGEQPAEAPNSQEL
jgi:hypothetical protein